jgi:hypothetical protein
MSLTSPSVPQKEDSFWVSKSKYLHVSVSTPPVTRGISISYKLLLWVTFSLYKEKFEISGSGVIVLVGNITGKLHFPVTVFENTGGLLGLICQSLPAANSLGSQSE